MKHNMINTDNETLKNKYPRTTAYATKLEDGWYSFDYKGNIIGGPFKTKAETENDVLNFLNMVLTIFWAHHPEIHNAVQLFFRIKDYEAKASELEACIRMFLEPNQARFGEEVGNDEVDWLIWTMAEQGIVYRD